MSSQPVFTAKFCRITCITLNDAGQPHAELFEFRQLLAQLRE